MNPSAFEREQHWAHEVGVTLNFETKLDVLRQFLLIDAPLFQAGR